VTGPRTDLLSELDKRIVVALQRDGRASWRAVAEAVGASVSTVARRGQQLLAQGTVKVAVMPALAADGPYDCFLLRINCTPGGHVDVADALVADPDVRFVTLVTGTYDVMAEIVVRGGATQYPRIIGDLTRIPGVARWRSDLILSVHKVSFDWSRQLYGELLGPHPDGAVGIGAQLEQCEPEHFDDVDRSILAVLREDGRETFQRIADGLGVHESSVRRRYDRMRSARCIDVLTLVPSAALGMEAETLMTITVAPSRLAAVAAELAAHPSVRYLAELLDENALLCEVIAPSARDLSTFITGSLARLDGVEGWAASMELLYLKRSFLETAWWRSRLGQEGT